MCNHNSQILQTMQLAVYMLCKDVLCRYSYKTDEKKSPLKF